MSKKMMKGTNMIDRLTNSQVTIVRCISDRLVVIRHTDGSEQIQFVALLANLRHS